MKEKTMIYLALLIAATLIFSGIYFVKAPITNNTKNMNDINTKSELSTVDATRFASLLKDYEDDPNAVLLDVRTSDEYNQGHIKGAKQLDFYQTETFLRELANMDKNKTYFIYCRSGNRAGQTLEIMRKLGFKKVYNLGGGIKAWMASNLPLER